MPKPSIVRLNSGYIEPMTQMPAETPSVFDRKALIVYTGHFSSMDGDVEVKDEDIERLIKNHNSFLAQFQRSFGGEFPVHAMPPMQLDHSVSSGSTVGRLPGMLEPGVHMVPAVLDEMGNMLEPAREAKAAYTIVRFLGRENVEKAMDGRYCHLSVGADFKKGKLQELSVTPFPAASDARLLSEKRPVEQAEGSETYKGYKITVRKGENSDWYYQVEGYDQQYGPCQKPEDAWEQARQCVEGLITSAKLKGETMFERLKAFLIRTAMLSAEDADKKMKEMPEEEKSKLAEQEKADRDRMKKYLTGQKKMTDEDAEKHMSDMNMDKVKELSAEIDEHEKKLAAETEATERAEEVKRAEGKKNMTAKQDELTKLSTDLRAKMDSTRMAARKAHIGARLSSLKFSAKITPAEIKKIDIAKLAAATDETIAEVLKTYADREPVILTGIIGSKKGVDTSSVAKSNRLAKLEAETRANMPFTSQASKTRLATEDKKPPAVEEMSAEHPVELQKEMDECFSMMDGGKIGEAKEKLKGMFGRYAKQLASEDAGTNEVEMSALAESVKSMQTDLTQVMQLASSLATAEKN